MLLTPWRTGFQLHLPQQPILAGNGVIDLSLSLSAGTIKASETLKTTSSEIAALAPDLTGAQARQAASAMSLMAINGAGSDLKLALACASHALECICQLHAASRAGALAPQDA